MFCVSIHPDLQRLQSELVAGFVDDLTLGCPAEIVAARQGYSGGYRPFSIAMSCNKLMPSQQSAYRQHHSTETAVLKVYNDLLMAADSGLVSALCLLDLAATFDTIDHDLLLLHLERQFGLRGVTLLWFRSYLSGRSYNVWFAGDASRIVYGVCSAGRQCTYQAVAFQSPKSLHDGIYAPLHVIS